MGKVVIVVGVMMIFHFAVCGQAHSKVYGIVQDSTGKAIPQATVALVSKNDTLHILTGSKGNYSFLISMPCEFELVVTRIGFKTYRYIFRVLSGAPDTMLEPIVLRVGYQEMVSVIVSRVKPVVIGEDTITYAAGAFPVRPGAEVESILKRLSGVELDTAGNLLVQGKKVGRVLIDGKDFFGDNVQLAIRNLPADIIDKIQIIDDYGEKGRLTGIKTGEPKKLLNLVLKKSKRNGFFGQMQFSAGNKNRYASDGFVNSFSGGRHLSVAGYLDNSSPTGNSISRQLGVSYADQWSTHWKEEWNISLSGDDLVTANGQAVDSYFGFSQLHQDRTNRTKGHFNNMNGVISLLFTPDAYHTVRISPSLRRQVSHQSIMNNFSTVEQDSTFSRVTEGKSALQTTTEADLYGVELYYEQLASQSRQRMNAKLNFHAPNALQQSDELFSSVIQQANVFIKTTQHYLTDNKSCGWNGSGRLNYFLPVGKSGFLEIGYGATGSKNKVDKTTCEIDSLPSKPILIDSLSHHYVFTSVEHWLHAGLNIHLGKTMLSVGFDGQTGNFEGTPDGKGTMTAYDYFKLLPTIQSEYRFSKFRSISVQYIGSPILPTLQQVEPITDMTDRQYSVTGNAHLRSGLLQNVNIRYEQSISKPLKFFSFGLKLGYSTTSNAIIEHIIHPRDSSSVLQKTTYVNVNGQRAFLFEYHVSLPALIHRYLRVNLRGDITDNRLLTMTDNIVYPARLLLINQSVQMQWIMDDLIESDLSINYTFNQSRYSGAASQYFSSSTIWLSWQGKLYFLHRGVFVNRLHEVLMQATGSPRRSNPILWTSVMEWQFFKSRSLTFRIVVNDLLNSGSGISQSASPNSVTKSQTPLIGRYFLCGILCKLEKFKELRRVHG